MKSEMLPAVVEPGPLAVHDDLARDRLGRSVRRAFVGVLAVIVGLAVTGVFGVRTSAVEAAAGGISLEVRAPSAIRAGLPASLSIIVRRAGGFDSPVRIAIDDRYLELFDEQGVRPAPSSESNDGRYLIWEFEPPEKDVLRVWVDVIVETGRHFGDDAQVAVLDRSGAAVVRVRFSTWIAP